MRRLEAKYAARQVSLNLPLVSTLAATVSALMMAPCSVVSYAGAKCTHTHHVQQTKSELRPTGTGRILIARRVVRVVALTWLKLPGSCGLAGAVYFGKRTDFGHKKTDLVSRFFCELHVLVGAGREE
jgi:hypothetical protein